MTYASIAIIIGRVNLQRRTRELLNRVRVIPGLQPYISVHPYPFP